MLLAECLAAALRVPGLLSSWLQRLTQIKGDAEGFYTMLLKGVQCHQRDIDCPYEPVIRHLPTVPERVKKACS
jgi:hypothetical protein